MMKRPMHECEPNRDAIVFGNGAWWLHANWTLRICVAYCPYCGLKLERPNAKIEVWRATLEDLAHIAKDLCSTIEEGAYSAAAMEAHAILSKLNRLVNDDRLLVIEKTDTKIEVSREGLESWVDRLNRAGDSLRGVHGFGECFLTEARDGIALLSTDMKNVLLDD